MRRLVPLVALAALLAGCASGGPDRTEGPRPALFPMPLPPERHHNEQNLSFSPGAQACAGACVEPQPSVPVTTEVRFSAGLLRYAIVVEWTPSDAQTQDLRLVVQDACDANATVLLGPSPLRVDAPGARPPCGDVRVEVQQPGMEAGPVAARVQESLPVHVTIDWQNERLTAAPPS